MNVKTQTRMQRDMELAGWPPGKVALEIIDRIEHSTSYDQSAYFSHAPAFRVLTAPVEEWPCGTTACVAGHAMHIAVQAGVLPAATVLQPWAVGATVLGLGAVSPSSAIPDLFSPSTSRAEVVCRLEQIAAQRPTAR